MENMTVVRIGDQINSFYSRLLADSWSRKAMRVEPGS